MSTVSFTEGIFDDPYAATRLAIVRAAAEIGKGVVRESLTTTMEESYYDSQKYWDDQCKEMTGE